VQWDIKDGERFGIGYIDANGKKKNCPVIIHASSFGSIERTLASLLENSYLSAKESGKNPILPLWLSPTQIRICPVSDDYLKAAEELADKLEKHNLRVDIDDKVESIPKKVRNAETDWVPLIIVFGEKEKSGDLMVRFRETGKTEKMSFEELVKLIHERTKGMPFRPLPVPRLLTKQVKFVG
jgi:threonyl-tRNA synthetase